MHFLCSVYVFFKVFKVQSILPWTTQRCPEMTHPGDCWVVLALYLGFHVSLARSLVLEPELTGSHYQSRPLMREYGVRAADSGSRTVAERKSHQSELIFTQTYIRCLRAVCFSLNFTFFEIDQMK